MTAMDAMELIASLSKRDRAWILRNLSESAQRCLRERASSERTGLDQGADTPRIQTSPAVVGKDSSPTKEDPAVADERAVEWLEGEQVAVALAGEPPWIVAMLLSLRSWQWEAQMLARIAPMTRLEVTQLRLSAPRVSDGMRRLLLSSLRARVVGIAAASPKAFERLLQGHS
jgi:hypothetical protein